MKLTILVALLLFWLLYYVFQGLHDVAFIKETRLLKQKITPEDFNSLKDQYVSLELAWKAWDVLEKALVKLAFAVLVFVLTGDFLFALLLFILSAALRWLLHDLVVAMGLGQGFRHIGPDYIATDRFLRWMQFHGLNQYVIKCIPILLLLALLLFHIF